MPYRNTVHQDLFMYAQAMFANEQAYGDWLCHQAQHEADGQG